jgi:chromosome transmission fidelity protein 1
VLDTCIEQLKVYLARFKTRLTATHATHLKRLVAFLLSLSRVCKDYTALNGAKKEKIQTVADFAKLLGTKTEGINLLEIDKYLKESRVARKISSYSLTVEEREDKKGSLFARE